MRRQPGESWDDTDESAAGTVLVKCAACGARMRADRIRCLHCEEPLVAAPTQITWSSLTSGRPLIILIASALVFVALVVVFWINRPTVGNDAAQPYDTAANAGRLSAPSTPAAAASGAARVEQPTFARAVTGSASSGEFLSDSRTADAAYATGDPSDGKLTLERVLAKNPNDPEALNNLGQVLVRLDDPSGAAEKFGKAIQLMPRKWAYHFNLAHVEAERSLWDHAIAEYREAARLFPTDYATQFNLAMALHKQGNDEDAVLAFRMALGLAPSEPAVHAALATSLENIGKIAEARRQYQQYVDLAPTAADAAAIKAHLETLAPAP